MEGKTETDLKESAANVTMHGFGRLLITKSKTSRFIWIALMLFFISLLFVSVVPTVKGYFESPSFTKQETIIASKLQFPAVTVCGPSLYKTKVKKFAAENNISLHTYHGRILNLLEVLVQAPRLDDFAPDEKDVVYSETPDIERIFVPSRGYCFKVNSNGSFIRRQSGPDNALNIIVFLNVSDGISFSQIHTGDSVEVIIQDHKQFPTLDAGTVLAPVGHLTQIEIKKTEIRRLKPPYPSKCTNGENMELLFKGDYTVSNCRISCLLKRSAEKCKYLDIIANHLLPKEKRVLNMNAPEQAKCPADVVKFFHETDFASCNCGLPCEEMRFQKFSSQSKWPSTEHMDSYKEIVSQILGVDEENVQDEYVRNNLISINVYFGNMEYERITEAPMYTPEKFIGEIGGQMGIWIGASIFSLLEVFYLFTQLVRVAWRKTKIKNANPEEGVESNRQ